MPRRAHVPSLMFCNHHPEIISNFIFEFLELEFNITLKLIMWPLAFPMSKTDSRFTLSWNLVRPIHPHSHQITSSDQCSWTEARHTDSMVRQNGCYFSASLAVPWHLVGVSTERTPLFILWTGCNTVFYMGLGDTWLLYLSLEDTICRPSTWQKWNFAGSSGLNVLSQGSGTPKALSLPGNIPWNDTAVSNK